MPTFVPKNHPLIDILPVEIATSPVTSFVQPVQQQRPRPTHDPVQLEVPKTGEIKQARSSRSSSQATKIQSLQEFRNYITSDVELERYTVVKFYAPW